MIFASVSGNLGKDAEMKDTKIGPICSFSVASEARVGSEKLTTWVMCSLFGKRGEALCRHLSKGSKVTVHGTLKQREHNGKTYLDLVVSEIVLMGGGSRSALSQGAEQQSKSPATTPGGGFSDEEYGVVAGDDFPF
jgi:single-strand DNA-binding protein